LTFKDEVAPAGRIAFKFGLAATGLAFFAFPFAEELSAVGVLALPATDLVFPLLAEEGANPLFIPKRPRFMILAGVTGVNCVPLVLPVPSELMKWLFLIVLLSAALDDEDGGAGGGILRSTGDGVSPGTSSPPAMLPLLERVVDLSNGVEFVDLDPLGTFLVNEGAVGRIAGDCFFLEGFSPAPSSPLEEAVRFFPAPEDDEEPDDFCCAAPSQGLVKGETSKSKSEVAEEKAMCAGAEVDPRGAPG